jgi:hypothetical protein
MQVLQLVDLVEQEYKTIFVEITYYWSGGGGGSSGFSSITALQVEMVELVVVVELL